MQDQVSLPRIVCFCCSEKQSERERERERDTERERGIELLAVACAGARHGDIVIVHPTYTCFEVLHPFCLSHPHFL